MRFRLLFLLAGAAVVLAACEQATITEWFEDDPVERRHQAHCDLGIEPDQLFSFTVSMRDRVAALLADGALNQGQARALGRHLDTIDRSMGAGQYCPAQAQLEAFRTQVQEFRDGGLLTDRQISDLLQAVRLLLPAAEAGPNAPAGDYAPGVTGELRTAQVRGEEITYEVIDGMAILHSDVILGYADEVEASFAASSPSSTAVDGPEVAASGACTVFPGYCSRWTDGIIGYDFADDWGDANDEMRRRINAAISHWQANTSMRFLQRSSGERLVFRNSGGCSSWIGRQEITFFDPQYINLNPDLCGEGAIIHEIGHAVGLHHEHNRWDRGSHVELNMGLVPLDQVHNFLRYLVLGQDVGPYEARSIMHYGCRAFVPEGVTANSLTPLGSDVTCADIPQRDRLTDGDIRGALTLYPPVYTITGASDGDVSDRFDLGLDFSSGPVPDRFLFWRTDRLTGPAGLIGPGRTAVVSTADLPEGEHLITAFVEVAGGRIASRSIRLTLSNDAPVVSLGPDRDVDLNRDVLLTPTVTDTEDGACLLSVCSYAWDPAPAVDRGGNATYRFDTVGPQTVSVTVTDRGGLSTTASVVLNVVNTPPVAEILSPASDVTASPGALNVLGRALDANVGPGPGPGEVSCSDLRWESTDPTDSWFNFSRGCRNSVILGDLGTRTIRLTAPDPMDPTIESTAEVQVTVVGCGDNCAPSGAIELLTPPELNGAVYSPPFSGPGYYLSTPISVRGSIVDADDPLDSPVTYEWRLLRPCFGGPCPPTTLASGTETLRQNFGVGWGSTELTFTPADYINPWDVCVTMALEHYIEFEVTDSRGASSTTRQRIYLACSLD